MRRGGIVGWISEAQSNVQAIATKRWVTPSANPPYELCDPPLYPRLIDLGLRLTFRPLLELGLRIAHGLREHIAQFGLRFRGCFGDGCLPMCHGHYVGMPEGHLNPTKALYQAGLPNIPVQNASISALNNSASPGRLPIFAPLRP